jgi:hypothetical protein
MVEPSGKRGEQPVYVIRLRPERQVVDPVKALRRALKVLLRRCGMRAVSVEQEHSA